MAQAENHVALNVALYGAGGRKWAFTERPAAALSRDATHLRIGPSALSWEGNTLVVRIDERTCPWPGRIHGTVRLQMAARTRFTAPLDAEGLHHWSPIAPCAHVQLALETPGLRWSGRGYLDHNRGAVPLEHSFRHWHWSRATTPQGTVVLYDVTRRDHTASVLSLLCDPSGNVAPIPPPPDRALPRSAWRVARATRADGPARVHETLEDTPFYARSLLGTQVLGAPAMAVHESLDLARFANPVVQWMLPFKAPRFWR